MSEASSQDWLNAFVQLGRFEDDTWTPVGGGFLFLDADVVWLVTARDVVDTAAGGRLAAWVGRPGTIVELSKALHENGLDWVRHEHRNIATCLFPLDASWNVKAFSEAASMRARDMTPLLQTCSLGALYGYDMGGRPPTLAIEGVLSSVALDQGHLFTSAPLLPANVGAPLLVVTASPGLGGTVLLAGILTQSLPVRPASDPMVPANLVPPQLHVSVAHPIGDVIGLIRSEAAAAQRAKVQGAG
jgi:hypothetical protein